MALSQGQQLARGQLLHQVLVVQVAAAGLQYRHQLPLRGFKLRLVFPIYLCVGIGQQVVINIAGILLRKYGDTRLTY